MKLGELTVTSVKTADGRSAQGDALLAKNIPSHVAIENLKRLCKWLEHLRAQYNLLYDDGSHPIVINSGYRSEEVNRKVGGAPNSNHLTGCAADIRVFGIEQAMRQGQTPVQGITPVRVKNKGVCPDRRRDGRLWGHTPLFIR